MAKATCPKCGAEMIETPRGFQPVGEEKCIMLKGTKYLDPTKVPTSGIQWCPSLSDAAPEDWVLLSVGDRPQVLSEIAKVKGSEKA